MTCKCGSDRILSVGAKASDMFYCSYKELEHDGYMPEIESIGGGDYIDIAICMDCGTVQGKFPIEDNNIRDSFEGA